MRPATAPKVLRTTVTTTTTTVTEDYVVAEGGDEDSEESRAARTERVARHFERIVWHYFRWKELVSWCGSVLNSVQRRQYFSKIALGKANPNRGDYAGAVRGSRWQHAEHLGHGRWQ